MEAPVVLNATHMMWQGLVWTISGLTAASAPAGAETAEWYGEAHDADGLLGNEGGETAEKPAVGSGLWFFYLFISVFLVCMAGTVAGMTISLMSFDSTYIEILTRCGDDEQRRLAKKISWFVNRHHLTLVTLLLGNAACNEALPIGLNKIVDEVAAILISVTAVLIVGEIVPTAILTGPNQLKYAARLTTVVWILLLLVYPIAKPVAMLLDHWLGDDHGTRYRREELKEFIRLHAMESRQKSIVSQWTSVTRSNSSRRLTGMGLPSPDPRAPLLGDHAADTRQGGYLTDPLSPGMGTPLLGSSTPASTAVAIGGFASSLGLGGSKPASASASSATGSYTAIASSGGASMSIFDDDSTPTASGPGSVASSSAGGLFGTGGMSGMGFQASAASSASSSSSGGAGSNPISGMGSATPSSLSSSPGGGLAGLLGLGSSTPSTVSGSASSAAAAAGGGSRGYGTGSSSGAGVGAGGLTLPSGIGSEILAKRGRTDSHGSQGSEGTEGSTSLMPDEVRMLESVLEMSKKKVSDHMVPYSRSFALSIDERLDRTTISHIADSTYSRIPVYYGKSKHKIAGVLIVKLLLRVDPRESLSLRDVHLRQPVILHPDTPLFEALGALQAGTSHMALVTRKVSELAAALAAQRPPPDSVKVEGLITMEDIFEQLLQEPIEDEVNQMAAEGGIHNVLKRSARTFLERGGAASTLITKRHSSPALFGLPNASLFAVTGTTDDEQPRLASIRLAALGPSPSPSTPGSAAFFGARDVPVAVPPLSLTRSSSGGGGGGRGAASGGAGGGGAGGGGAGGGGAAAGRIKVTLPGMAGKSTTATATATATTATTASSSSTSSTTSSSTGKKGKSGSSGKGKAATGGASALTSDDGDEA